MQKDPTVIPASVTAQVSLRIVPDQSLDAVCNSLVQHLRTSFDALCSANSIKVGKVFFGALGHPSVGVFTCLLDNKVTVEHTADWWLGDLTHPWFLELERAIHDEWGAEPMRVREGGVRLLHPSNVHRCHLCGLIDIVDPVRAVS